MISSNRVVEAVISQVKVDWQSKSSTGILSVDDVNREVLSKLAEVSLENAFFTNSRKADYLLVVACISHMVRDGLLMYHRVGKHRCLVPTFKKGLRIISHEAFCLISLLTTDESEYSADVLQDPLALASAFTCLSNLGVLLLNEQSVWTVQESCLVDVVSVVPQLEEKIIGTSAAYWSSRQLAHTLAVHLPCAAESVMRATQLQLQKEELLVKQAEIADLQAKLAVCQADFQTAQRERAEIKKMITLPFLFPELSAGRS